MIYAFICCFTLISDYLCDQFFFSLLQGMILLWDVDSGLSQIDKYLSSTDNHVVAGALLGVGIVNCGITNECDPVSSISFIYFIQFLFLQCLDLYYLSTCICNFALYSRGIMMHAVFYIRHWRF